MLSVAQAQAANFMCDNLAPAAGIDLLPKTTYMVDRFIQHAMCHLSNVQHCTP